MLKISVSNFSKIVGIDYPKTAPSLSSLIDSIPEEETLKCLGKLIQLYSEYAPIRVETSKSSIFYILSQIEKNLSEVECNFNSLVTLYYGIENTTNNTEIWSYTNTHKLICKELGFLNMEKIYPYKIFTLVCKSPDAKFMGQLRSLINNCVKDTIQSSNFILLNQYVRTLLTIFQFVNCDSYGDELLNSLLVKVWTNNTDNNSIPTELPLLVHKLVNAVVLKNSELFEATLKALISNYGKPSINLVNSDLKHNDEKNISWWDRNKIDPNWWREQD
jgi:hypothetical protein